ncbi:protein RhsB [Escherichia coli]|nr:protein RhsB [Escherichia coli]
MEFLSVSVAVSYTHLDVYKRQEYDEWGNLLSDENPHHLQQLIRLPGQQYDEESGLYYNLSLIHI